jgi:hypothetical protein
MLKTFPKAATPRQDKTNARGKFMSNISDLYIASYNIYLTLRYNCHIIVKIVTNVSDVKYLYKYVYNGLDRAFVCVGEM